MFLDEDYRSVAGRRAHLLARWAVNPDAGEEVSAALSRLHDLGRRWHRLGWIVFPAKLAACIAVLRILGDAMKSRRILGLGVLALALAGAVWGIGKRPRTGRAASPTEAAVQRTESLMRKLLGEDAVCAIEWDPPQDACRDRRVRRIRVVYPIGAGINCSSSWRRERIEAAVAGCHEGDWTAAWDLEHDTVIFDAAPLPV